MAQTPYKFHPSTQLYTPTNPPIHIVMHVLQVQQHERIFHLIYHHSHPPDHLPISPRVSGHFLSLKNMYNAQKLFNPCTSCHPSLSVGVELLYPTTNHRFVATFDTNPNVVV